MKALLNHTSENTAYIVDDYPYGFRLRCKIRYWIEESKTHGFRFCSQTTNPKLSIERWNAPKKGTYCKVAMGMYQDETNGHVEHCSLSIYSDHAESVAFKEKWDFCLNESARKSLDMWIYLKQKYEAARDRGDIKLEIKASEPILLTDLVR